MALRVYTAQPSPSSGAWRGSAGTECDSEPHYLLVPPAHLWIAAAFAATLLFGRLLMMQYQFLVHFCSYCSYFVVGRNHAAG